MKVNPLIFIVSVCGQAVEIQETLPPDQAVENFPRGAADLGCGFSICKRAKKRLAKWPAIIIYG
jgi:hypothetical protein